MKVTYEYFPNEEGSDDAYELKKVQNASNMCSALSDLDSVRRNLSKGYKYYDESTESVEDDKFSRINVDLLLVDICEILTDSKIDELEF